MVEVLVHRYARSFAFIVWYNVATFKLVGYYLYISCSFNVTVDCQIRATRVPVIVVVFMTVVFRYGEDFSPPPMIIPPSRQRNFDIHVEFWYVVPCMITCYISIDYFSIPIEVGLGL